MLSTITSNKLRERQQSFVKQRFLTKLPARAQKEIVNIFQEELFWIIVLVKLLAIFIILYYFYRFCDR